ncbi:carbohydrate ABC transporter substrate-binding protein, CUT1 family [Leifsonia sp. 98AMF]|uniref:extracellular solute-binding protein n=1 Tax=unclassified Leifsonia TaxID=2663824 RepID=UPI00087AEE72|nr:MULTISPECIES: extracellular solute-binding protein [unclassified Leifsonia]SDH55131.1 carbohydrate ABC transporter substrate-binding protein, CUT1 family [Leifsonia sp. 197AMF]SDI83564.1 carbohydrate ABC transporter substrate-binding protein, CUT1 family [Leifsonia sp. 466MF]SDJ99956.1 carbohydrate ABC transporter substrate-binding protein, CUT1 family [Leifsonia sp. 157MF]SDN86793.1 carbohydrate ABC transporter substrate-binding protein, CUT1 family [Leifsonia sp. 509MF]SEN19373.1 carbohyd
MKRKLVGLAAVATASALVLAGCASGGSTAASTDGKGKTVTLWLVGSDTPDKLRDYLKTEFNKETGATLKIEQQDWGDIVTKLTTALPDANNTPDVTEMGNTQSPTFTNVGAFLDISDMYKDLGGSDLLPSFVEAGKVDGKNYTLPYYFGSRYMFYRKDIYQAAGVSVPTTLDQFNTNVADITAKNPKGINNFSGFFLGGQDWRDGISWIFANGGDIAKKDGDKWKATLESEESLKGLQQLQDLYKNASKAPNDAKDSNQYIYLNDTDQTLDADGNKTGDTSLAAATIMAPGWAHWSIGDLGKGDDGKPTRTWNDATFGTFVLPGNDGKPAPVFAGGSNIGISAKTKEPGLSKTLLKIIFSKEYQEMLGKNGLGPANEKYTSSLGDDQFAKALIESASNSKLTPAAPGWASVEAGNVMEEFFSKIRDASDLKALAQEYDKKIDALLNVKS